MLPLMQPGRKTDSKALPEAFDVMRDTSDLFAGLQPYAATL
jgi:hypothetical protein